MLIFWEKRLVFLATPKAGSTAIEVALESLACVAVQRPPALKHSSAAHFEAFIRPWLASVCEDTFTSVALMREPIEWLQSWYRFHQFNGTHNAHGTGFEGFINAYLADPAAATDGVCTQARFLGDDAKRVDRIFSYDRIDQFTRFLEDQLDCEVILPRINVPPEVDVSLSTATRAKLEDFLAADFALYRTVSAA